MESRITVSNLSAGYNGIPVFQNINIEIPSGEITTLIGSNGSGKSTILKTMSRLLAPSEGTVHLDGESIHQMSTKSVAQKLALLHQGAQTPSQITVADLVEYGRFPYRTKLSGLTSEDREIISWALESTNMTELSDREMDQLSGGQRQRGWIAMALAQKTGILFLDEPTTYLDISHQLEILQLLRRLNVEQGVTIVMVLHDLNHAIMFSDYLITIKDGKKYKAGTPAKVITPDVLLDVFDVVAEVIMHPILDVPVCLPYGVKGHVFKK
jgi:iron complex transport system ATP-binding protein